MTTRYVGADLDAGSTKVTSVATPVAGTDAANKNYVDSSVVAYTAGNGLTDSPLHTFNVANTDGNLTITANSVDFSTAAAAVITSAVKKYSNATIGNGTLTTIDVVHGISGGVTLVYGVSLMDNSTFQLVIADYVILSSTTFRLIFSTAPTTNQFTLTFGY